MRTTLILLALALLTRDLHSVEKIPMPDTLSGALTYGCSIADSNVKGQDRKWLVRVWIHFADHDWKYLFAIRSQAEHLKVYDDCKDWTREYEKRAQNEIH